MGSSCAKDAGVIDAGSVKVYYWPARGRAEQVRLALAVTNISWEDVTVANYEAATRMAFMENCRELGGNLTTNMPMLELDGKFYTESTAIVKYVCSRGGLQPKSPEEAYQVDNIIARVSDLRDITYKSVKGLGGSMGKEELVEKIEKHLKNMERLLSGDYFVGNRVTAADICVYDVLDTMVETQLPGHLAAVNCPKLIAFRERMGKVKQIAAYHETEQHKKLMAFPAL